MPKVVAVVGASGDRHKFGNRAVRAFVAQGHTVIPINPHEEEIEGLKTYKSVLDVPGAIDMATVYVQPDVGVGIMDDLARKGVGEIWLNPGADDQAVIERARALNLKPIVACSIIGIGRNPYDF